MNGIVFRKAGRKDVPGIFELEKLCFPHPWTYDMLFDDICKNKITEYIVAEKDGTYVGYGGMWIIFDEAHITNICIHPAYRLGGVGSALLEAMFDTAVEKGAARMTLEVRVSNVSAMKLYEKYGFHICGKRTGYYSDNGEDAYVLWKEELRGK